MCPQQVPGVGQVSLDYHVHGIGTLPTNRGRGNMICEIKYLQKLHDNCCFMYFLKEITLSKIKSLLSCFSQGTYLCEFH